MKIRIAYLRTLGAKVGQNSVLGKLNVLCPASLVIGSNCEIRNNISFWVKRPFDATNSITIGNNAFIGQNVEFNCSGQINIGDNTLIGSSVVFVDSGHTFEKKDLMNRQPIKVENIIVEEDVWIGSGSIILKGVKIGNGAIIGANSLVNKSIPPYEIWVGSPARKIGERK